MNIFPKKNLILKTIFILFLFIAVFLFLNFFYNQNRNILASEEEIEIDYEKLQCGREIPVGEAMEKTAELMEEIIIELEKIDMYSYYLIKSHKEMEELAKECSLENCIPKCELKDVDLKLPYCFKEPCQGEPCPEKEKIEELFNEITYFNEEIQKAKEKIYMLIYENVEPLCIKENEDIRYDWEDEICKAHPACWEWTRERILDRFPEWLEKIIEMPCPTITVQEAVKRKLNLSRVEFSDCYIHPQDAEKIMRGELAGKYLLSCPVVSRQNWPRYTKTEIEVEDETEGKIKIPVCTSDYNWFCCF